MRRIIGSLILGILLGTLIIACNRGNTPEGVVKGYLAAVSAGDVEKARSYISPDRQNRYYLNPAGEFNRGVKYTVNGTVVTDLGGERKTVTVIGTRATNSGSTDGRWSYTVERWSYTVEKIDGRWYIADYLG